MQNNCSESAIHILQACVFAKLLQIPLLAIASIRYNYKYHYY